MSTFCHCTIAVLPPFCGSAAPLSRRDHPFEPIFRTSRLGRCFRVYSALQNAAVVLISDRFSRFEARFPPFSSVARGSQVACSAEWKFAQGQLGESVQERDVVP